ncbi:unnamed protein product, partial [Allacma fusca]
MDSGENSDVLGLPPYSHNLVQFLNEEHLEFSKHHWFELILQTRRFYENQAIDLTNSNSRKTICALVCNTFPKINVKTFSRKFTKSVANHRNYVQKKGAVLEEQYEEIDGDGCENVSCASTTTNHNESVTEASNGNNESSPCNDNVFVVSTPKFVEGAEKMLSWRISNIQGSDTFSPIDSNEPLNIDSLSYIGYESEMELINSECSMETT